MDAHGHTCTHHCLSTYSTHTHMRTLTHTSALRTAHSHFSFAQDVMKSPLLLKLSEGRLESSLSPTHTLHLALTHSHILSHTHTHPRAES